jgi:L-threonylcarbamoyladenylate synthase
MQTVLTRDPREAARFIKRGETVAFPTETVYGLGANLFDEAAVAKIFAAKQRPPDNPLIAHISDLRDLDLIAENINATARKLIETFFPAPLTLVLHKRARVPFAATAGLETIGVRMPRYELALEFIRACRAPVAAPSANLSGRPSPTTWQAVKEDLEGRIACILIDEQTEIGLESTVVDCTSEAPRILRAGSVTLEQLRAVVPEIQLANIKIENEPARSPGMKYRHYAPRARVHLIKDANELAAREIATREQIESAYIGLREPKDLSRLKICRVCASVEDYARELFRFFRACDAADVQTIFCERVEEKGLGAALMERLRKAADESE